MAPRSSASRSTAPAGSTRRRATAGGGGVYKDGQRVQPISRNGVDHTRRFGDLAAAISKLSARTLVLDGEVAIFDQQLRSRFDWLRNSKVRVINAVLDALATGARVVFEIGIALVKVNLESARERRRQREARKTK